MKISVCILAATAGLLTFASVTATAIDTMPSPATEQSAELSSEERMQQIPHTLKALADAKAGEYGKLRNDDRRRLDAAEREITVLQQQHQDLNDLDEEEQVKLFNAQETIIAIVNGLKHSQLVCTYEQRIGTRFRTKRCVTRAVAEARAKAAKETLNALQNPMCTPGDGNPCHN